MKIGILRTLVAIGATCLVTSAVSAGECLDYQPAMATIRGSLSLMPAYGPPGFGEDPAHDAREDHLAITLDSPACMDASSKPQTEDVAETDIRTMQLVFRNSDAFRQAKQWIGKKISVTGGPYHRFTGHHHTAVLLQVENITEAVKPPIR
jgi:hypothetical protein